MQNRPKIGIGIEIVIENRYRNDAYETDFDPDNDSDFELGENPNLETGS